MARLLQSRLSDSCVSCPRLAFYDETSERCVSFEDKSLSYERLVAQLLLAVCVFGAPLGLCTCQ